MGKKRWKTVAISVATLLLLSLLVFWVFRDHYQEILQNIRAVSPEGLLLLLGVGFLYQMFESAACFVLVRRRLPKFSLAFSEMFQHLLLALFPFKAIICTAAD